MSNIAPKTTVEAALDLPKRLHASLVRFMMTFSFLAPYGAPGAGKSPVRASFARKAVNLVNGFTPLCESATTREKLMTALRSIRATWEDKDLARALDACSAAFLTRLWSIRPQMMTMEVWDDTTHNPVDQVALYSGSKKDLEAALAEFVSIELIYSARYLVAPSGRNADDRYKYYMAARNALMFRPADEAKVAKKSKPAKAKSDPVKETKKAKTTPAKKSPAKKSPKAKNAAK